MRSAHAVLVLMGACSGGAEEEPSDAISVDLPEFSGPIGLVIVGHTTMATGLDGSLSASFAADHAEHPYGFLSPHLWADPLGCTPAGEVAGCPLMRCREESPPVPFPHAGTVTIGTTELTPEASNGAYLGIGFASGASPFAAGDTLTVEAQGDTVPAFEGPITVPEPFELVVPAFSEAPPTYSVHQPLPLEWTSLNPLPTVVTVGGTHDAGTTIAACAFDSAAGGASVPAAVLEALDGAEYGYFTVSQYDIATVPAAPYTVALVGEARARIQYTLWEW